MQKHDKMVALAKEKSAEMTETAITAIKSKAEDAGVRCFIRVNGEIKI